jgi:hypothetical protein
LRLAKTRFALFLLFAFTSVLGVKPVTRITSFRSQLVLPEGSLLEASS